MKQNRNFEKEQLQKQLDEMKLLIQDKDRLINNQNSMIRKL
jgi:hypothetical protein